MSRIAALRIQREVALFDQMFKQESPYPRPELLMLVHGSPPPHNLRIATPLQLTTQESLSDSAAYLTG